MCPSDANETITLKNKTIYCNVREYFDSLNVDNSSTNNILQFIINEKFILSCNSIQERHKWIAAIIKTNNYNIKDDIFNIDYRENNCGLNGNNNDHDHENDYNYQSRLVDHATFERNEYKLECVSIKCKISDVNTAYIEFNMPTNWHKKSFNSCKESLFVLIKDSINIHCGRGITNDMQLFIINKSKSSDVVTWNLYKMNDTDSMNDFQIRNKHIFALLFHQHKRILQKYNNQDCCPNGLKCVIYNEMKNNYKYTRDNYNHLLEFNHFRNDIINKPICKYGTDCNAFKRMDMYNDGKNRKRKKQDSNRFDDKCHLAIFRHPPRNDRQARMSQNANKLIIIDKATKIQEAKKMDYKIEDLIFEVCNNGYKSDLYLYDAALSSWFNFFTLLYVANEKMDSIYHKKLKSPLNRAEMLALILYTSCDCNYDLSHV